MPREPSDSSDTAAVEDDRPTATRTRRGILAAASAAATGAVAGCFAAGGGPPADGADDDGPPGGADGDADGDPGDSPEEGVEPPEPPEDHLGHAEVVQFENGPRTVALPGFSYYDDCGVNVLVRFEEPATDDSPAVLRAGLFNERPYAQTVELRDLPPFEQTTVSPAYGDLHRSLYLVPTEETPLARVEPEYERGPDGYWRVRGGARDWLPERVELGPEEAIGGLFYLLGEPNERGFPPRQYAFGRDDRLQLTVWDTDAPGPSPDSRFEEGDLPQLPLDERTVWYHEADPETPRYLVPSRERAELPAGIAFELVNNSAESLSGGGGTWDLYKLVDGEWFLLAPRWRTAEARFLAAGGRREWSFLGFHGRVPDGVEGAVHGHLGGGTYAFRARYRHDREETYAAALELEGERIEPEPRGDVTVEREDDRVVVTSERYDEDAPASVTVRRVGGDGTNVAPDGEGGDDADGVEDRVVAEQVMSGREPALRDALPFFEPDVETVELRTDGWTARSAVPDDADERRFAYRDAIYEATWTEGGEAGG